MWYVYFSLTCFAIGWLNAGSHTDIVSILFLLTIGVGTVITGFAFLVGILRKI